MSYQCWHCGNYVDTIFHCDFCNQDYCNLHKNPINHNCISIIDLGSLSEQNTNILIQTPAPEVTFPANGKIILDDSIISESIRKFIQF